MLLASLALMCFTFAYPLIRGYRCLTGKPTADEVRNCAISFPLVWGIGWVHSLLIAEASSVSVLAQIIFLVYLQSPKFNGSLHIYNKFLAGPVEKVAPAIDHFTKKHTEKFRQEGYMYVISQLRVLQTEALRLYNDVSSPTSPPAHSSLPSREKLA